MKLAKPEIEVKVSDVSTEEMILRAAENEFMLKGFAGAKTTSIAEAAGVTHAMLHYYFRTKEKLFEKIISNKLELLQEIILGSLSQSDRPFLDRLRSAIEQHLEFLATVPALPRFIINIVAERPELESMIRDRILSKASVIIPALQEQIDESARRGDCRHVEARTLLLDIISLNLFSFVAMPLINIALDNMMEDMETFVENRKKDNVDTIMRKLRP